MANGTDERGDELGAIVPTITALQTDVGFANKYRLELIKTSLTVAAALLAFTVTFRPNLSAPQCEWLMWVGWIGLGLSTLGAMGNMYGWEQFYISYRDYKLDQDERESASVTRSHCGAGVPWQYNLLDLGLE